MRQRRLLVRQVVDVEEERAGDVLAHVLRFCIAACRRQMPARVEDDEVGGVEMRSEPVCLNDPLLGALQHVSLSYSVVNGHCPAHAAALASDIGKSGQTCKDCERQSRP